MEKNEKPPANVMGNVINNAGIVTQGQVGNNYLHTGPKYGEISPQDIANLKAHVREGAKVGIVQTIQDAPTAQFASELKNTLEKHGFNVDQTIGIQIGGPYFKGINAQRHPDGQVTILIGDIRQ